MPVGQEACKTVARPILPMSAIQDSSLLPPLHPPPNWIPPIQVQPPALPPAPEPGRIIFTRQLWQRTMPEDSSEHGVSTRSQSQGSLSAYQANASISRRGSSNVSTRSLRSAPSASDHSKAPLTPEESPPSRPTSKRSINVAEEEDREIDSHEVTPVHTRASSGDSTAHVCICQPDPKIPRPRNGKCPR
jgi:HMG box factor